MDLGEKLVALRKQKGWTQEEMAESLFVSRTAISKWESGRGYPNIDSLKAIAKLFSVSIDELLSSDELIMVAETDVKEKVEKTKNVVFGLVDCMLGLLFVLPLFSQVMEEQYISVSLLQLTDVSIYMKVIYVVLIVLFGVFGILQLAFQNIDHRFWKDKRNYVSLLMNIIGLLIFILGKQPYPAAFLLFALLIKGILMYKVQ